MVLKSFAPMRKCRCQWNYSYLIFRLTEYENDYQKILKQNNLNFIFLITPETSEERIRKIDSLK